MRTAIDALLATGLPVRPPLTDRELADLATNLDATLPSELVSLYRAFGGLDESGVPRFPMRLMPPAEVVSVHALLQANAESLSPAVGVRYFWTDDNSNWGGVFVTGPLAGCVNILDHDEPDEVPRYRSVASFFSEFVRASETGTNWYDMPTDYPSPAALDPTLHARDGALERALRDELSRASTPEARERLALQILCVAPATSAVELVEFLGWESRRVKYEACRLMGRRDLHAAIPALAAIARVDTWDSPVIEALIALGQMTDPSAFGILRELRATCDPGLADYFPEPLR